MIMLIAILLITSGVFVALVLNPPDDEQDNADDDPWVPTQHYPYVEPLFSGVLAEHFVEEQLDFGYRIPGTEDHAACRDFIRDTMIEFGYTVEYQNFTWNDTPGTNIIARKNWSSYYMANLSVTEDYVYVHPGTFVFGAHYDTRPSTEYPQDGLPIMGANDGASGVAVLLELARVLSVHPVNMDLEFVFFDLEDSGILSEEYARGAKVYAESLTPEHKENIVGAVVVDMIGDRDLDIYYNRDSDEDLNEELWKEADKLDFQEFHHEAKHPVFDDHKRLIKVGIPTALLIDFEYDHWHTQNDTLDKVSGDSLEKVGRVLERFMYTKANYLKVKTTPVDISIDKGDTLHMEGRIVHVNGDIQVDGSLNIVNAMLIINSENGFEHSLNIQKHGILTVTDSTITSPSRNLVFEVRGKLRITNSLIEQLWGNTLDLPHEGGIQIYSPDFLIEDSTVRYSDSRGIFIQNVTATNSPAIKNCSVLHNGEIGLYVSRSSVEVTGTQFEGNGMGAIRVVQGDITLRDSIIGTCYQGGTCTTGDCNGPDPSYGIEFVSATGNSIIEGTSFENMDKGIVASYVDESGGHITIDDITMEGLEWGIDLLHASPVIKNSHLNGLDFAITVQSSDPVIKNNRLTDSFMPLRILTSNGNVTGNTITGSEFFGIYLERSKLGVRNNTVSDTSSGIRVYRDRGSEITGNHLTGNIFGLNGSTDDISSPTMVDGNSIFGNHYGIYWLGNISCLERDANVLTDGNETNPGGDVWEEQYLTVNIFNATQDVVVEFYHNGSLVRGSTISKWTNTQYENLTMLVRLPDGSIQTFTHYTVKFMSGDVTIQREIDMAVDSEISVDIAGGS